MGSDHRETLGRTVPPVLFVITEESVAETRGTLRDNVGAASARVRGFAMARTNRGIGMLDRRAFRKASRPGHPHYIETPASPNLSPAARELQEKRSHRRLGLMTPVSGLEAVA